MSIYVKYKSFMSIRKIIFKCISLRILLGRKICVTPRSGLIQKGILLFSAKNNTFEIREKGKLKLITSVCVLLL